ncbi:hypothetical protein OC842_001683 [Tilletia horrida]|uniref:Phosphoglycerate mutase family protein n=1 Tax=Tilletia horrida TaxID=155126 RepID=A0AAN6JSX7_9BASI|nr:hypothetical protein OC842_001683 [Tilletia horrida]KAK0559370.1 hypothetical protein OC844_004462 [Tilletia horrida]
MLFRNLALPLLAASTAWAAVSNEIYLIRHGEKTSDDSVGLSTQGQQRAQCLRNVFGRSSTYRIGKIFAQASPMEVLRGSLSGPPVGARTTPSFHLLRTSASQSTQAAVRTPERQSSDSRARFELMTGQSSHFLSDRDDIDCVHDKIHAFADKSSLDILVCWEHDALEDIGKAIGQGFSYPSSHFDLIFHEHKGSLTSNSPYSEKCPGLDS